MKIAQLYLLLSLLISSFQLKANGFFSNPTVSATDMQTSILTIKKLGRYSIEVNSEFGTAIQLNNKRTGFSQKSGLAGKKNGRLDLMLEKGDYKLYCFSKEKGKGHVKLSLTPFNEVKKIQFLKQAQLLSDTLQDYQQITYAFEIESDRYVTLQAGGRYLNTLVLWKNGQWRVETPDLKIARLEPIAGEPIRYIVMHQFLSAGRYKVTLYGKKALAWTQHDEQQLVHMQMGFATLNQIKQAKIMSPFGFDYWKTSGQADYYRLFVDKPAQIKMHLYHFRKKAPLNIRYADSAFISIKNTEASTEIFSETKHSARMLRIDSQPGQPYQLIHFKRNHQLLIKGNNRYYPLTIQSAKPDENIFDRTAIFAEINHRGVSELSNIQSVKVSKTQSFRRKFNLISRVTFYLYAEEHARYYFSSHDNLTSFRLEKFFVRPPAKYKTPSFYINQPSWVLEKGFYKMTLRAQKNHNGLSDITIRHKKNTEVNETKPFNAIKAFSLYFKRHKQYRIFTGRQEGVQTAMLTSILPKHPVIQPPPQASIQFRQQKWPKLQLNHSLYSIINKNTSKNFQLNIKQPAVYQVVSNGLLDLQGRIRTVIHTNIHQEISNKGGNFAIPQFLSPGQYQVSVKSLKGSAGHFSLTLSKQPLTFVGEMKEGVITAAELPIASALAYTIKISSDGEYQFDIKGLGHAFYIRLEDRNGWPIFNPAIQDHVSVFLKRGHYRLIILSSIVKSRVVSRFQRVDDKLNRIGHGPHLLPFNEKLTHRWLESPENTKRVTDKWHFNLSAKIQVALDVDQNMLTTCYYQGQFLFKIKGKTWHGELLPGKYQLQIQSLRINHRYDYSLKISSPQWYIGRKGTIKLPTKIPLVISQQQALHISTFVSHDHRMKVFDEKMNLLEQIDDTSNNWNIDYLRIFSPGLYYLQFEGIEKRKFPVELAISPSTTPTKATFLKKNKDNGIIPLNNQLRFNRFFQLTLYANGEPAVQLDKYKKQLHVNAKPFKIINHRQWINGDIVLDKQHLMAYHFALANYRLSFNMQAQTGVLLLRDNQVVDWFYAQEKPLNGIAYQKFEGLWFFSLAEKSAISVKLKENKPLSLRIDSMLKIQTMSPGELHIPLKVINNSMVTLNYNSKVRSLALLTNDYLQTQLKQVRDSGILRVKHHLGSILIWPDERQYPVLKKTEHTILVKKSMSVNYRNPSIRLQSQSFEPRLLSLFADMPTLLQVENRKAHVFNPKTLSHQLLLAGLQNIYVHALKQNLATDLHLTYHAKIALQPGINKGYLMPPFSARLFHFAIDSPRRIALGFQAQNETFEGQLYDANAQLIKQGGQLFVSLDAGQYYYVIRSENPHLQEIRPIYLGSTNPPPYSQETLNKYLLLHKGD